MAVASCAAFIVGERISPKLSLSNQTHNDTGSEVLAPFSTHAAWPPRGPAGTTEAPGFFAMKAPIEVAGEALAKLTELFSDPNLRSKTHFRCSTDGPTEFDVLFESIIDDQFGYNPNSEYKNWVRRLYGLGLTSRFPSEWEAPETPEGISPA